MEHVYLYREGDREIINQRINILKEKEKKELIAIYNRQVDIGIVGVHAQALHIIAIHHSLVKKFGISPITISENILPKLNSKILLYNGSWRYI